jgi:hypothetical protein
MSDNKAIVEAAFERWSRGEQGFHPLMTEDTEFTITGTSVLAGTHLGRQAYVDEVGAPVRRRLAEPIQPEVRMIMAEGETVVVVWEGHAVALDGDPYENTYCWIITLEKSLVTKVTVFFDSGRAAELWERAQGYLDEEEG